MNTANTHAQIPKTWPNILNRPSVLLAPSKRKNPMTAQNVAGKKLTMKHITPPPMTRRQFVAKAMHAQTSSQHAIDGRTQTGNGKSE
jgi:hypothetical protein